MKTISVILFLISLSFFSCNRSPVEWPGWRGANRDGVVSNFDVPDNWPAELKKVWTLPIGACDASPVLTDNRLYLHVRQEGNEVSLCLDAETGAVIWRTITNEAPEVTGGPRTHPGPRSTPFVADGKMYTLGVGGTVNCLDARSGEIIWTNTEYKEVPEFFAAMSPLVDGNRCFMHLGGRETGAVVAFNATTGEKLWELKGHPATYASPVLMKLGKEKVLVVQTESHLIGVSLDGNLLWQLPTPGERRFYNASTPVIDGTRIIIAGQGLGTKSYDVQKQGQEYVLTQKWANPDYGVSFNTPLLKEGYLYGHEARLGKVFCLNAETGQTCWADTVAHNRFASTLGLGNEILSLTADGTLMVYDATAERYVEKAAYAVSNKEIYAHPLVAGNKLYIKDQEDFTCWEIN